MYSSIAGTSPNHAVIRTIFWSLALLAPALFNVAIAQATDNTAPFSAFAVPWSDDVNQEYPTQLRIRGQVVDDSPVSSVQLLLQTLPDQKFVDEFGNPASQGNPIEAAVAASGHWAVDVNLQPSQIYQVSVRGIDSVGNVEIWKVSEFSTTGYNNGGADDTTSPVTTIAVPLDGGSGQHFQTNLRFRGQVIDDSPVNSVQLLLQTLPDLNYIDEIGNPASQGNFIEAAVAASGHWAVDVTLQPSQSYRVSVRGIDSVGNVGIWNTSDFSTVSETVLVENAGGGQVYEFEGQNEVLTLDVSASNIGINDQIQVLVNDTPIGYLSQSVMGTTGITTLPVSQELQLSGSNRLEFQAVNAVGSWNISDVELTTGCNYPLVLLE